MHHQHPNWDIGEIHTLRPEVRPHDTIFGPRETPGMRSLLVCGSGDISQKQIPSISAALEAGIPTAIIDVADGPLASIQSKIGAAGRSDLLKGFVLPTQIRELNKWIGGLEDGMVDVVLVNNPPHCHLISAVQFNGKANRFVVQKPLDLDPALTANIGRDPALRDFLTRIWVHDHYRGKDGIPMVCHQLPDLIATHGKLKRITLVLTEDKDIRIAERHRLDSLRSGMMNDLGVHCVSILLEQLMQCQKWRLGQDSNEWQKRVGGTIELVGCAKSVQTHVDLDPGSETFAVLDFKVTEHLEGPFDEHGVPLAGHRRTTNQFDCLMVVGKGVRPDFQTNAPVKAVKIEFGQPSGQVTLDLVSMGVSGVASEGLNIDHGGINRSVFNLLPSPPSHATKGFGDPAKFSDWQSYTLGRRVMEIISAAKSVGNGNGWIKEYAPGKPIMDLVRDATQSQAIRPYAADISLQGLFSSGFSKPKYA